MKMEVVYNDETNASSRTEVVYLLNNYWYHDVATRARPPSPVSTPRSSNKITNFVLQKSEISKRQIQ